MSTSDAVNDAETAAAPGVAIERADDAPKARAWRIGRRSIDPKLLLASLAIALGLVMVGFALVTAVTGDEATNLPSSIESVTPAVAAVQVLQQTQVIVDLAEGFEGRLAIDDVALDTIRLDEIGQIDVEPGEQIPVPPGAVFEPGNDTLTFTPSESAPIERFAPGIHRVVLTYWKSIEGEDQGRTFVWTFEAI